MTKVNFNCELRQTIVQRESEPVEKTGGGYRWVKKTKPKNEISYEDFIRDEKGNLVLKK